MQLPYGNPLNELKKQWFAEPELIRACGGGHHGRELHAKKKARDREDKAGERSCNADVKEDGLAVVRSATHISAVMMLVSSS